MEISEFLRARMNALGLSLSDLETRLTLHGYSVQRATIGHWTSGRNKPPLKDREFIDALAESLEMGVNEMLQQMNFIVLADDRSPTTQRIADLVEHLPPEKQDLALRLIQELAKT